MAFTFSETIKILFDPRTAQADRGELVPLFADFMPLISHENI